MFIAQKLSKILETIPSHVTLVAVSKTKSIAEIKEAYEAGQRHFGENKVQEMQGKQAELPTDIKWHMIGHLQSNKIKYMAHFVHLIHGVDSLDLLKEINKHAAKHHRVINCLLQVYIAQEETKFGMDYHDVENLVNNEQFLALKNIKIVGLMGMASFTEDKEQVRGEFKTLHMHFEKWKELYQMDNFHLEILSMGMSDDYKIAIEEGSTMVRIGSAIFGSRNYIA